MSIISWADLPPGVYQVGSPKDIETIPAPVSLRELDHYWEDVKNSKRGDEWVKTVTLRINSEGILLQANAIGSRAVSRVEEIDRQRVRVIAKGWCLDADGILTVIEKSKEYDMAAELMSAALKKVRANRGSAPSEEQSVALVKSASEDAALALVSTLPAIVKAEVMEARLEVQKHREALCRTKAENQCHLVFIRRAGGITKRPQGKGDVTLQFQRSRLMRLLDSDQVKRIADSLYGPDPSASSAQKQEPEEPEQPDAQVLEAEIVDSNGNGAADEGGPQKGEAADAPGPWDDEKADPAPAPMPTREEALAEVTRLWRLSDKAVQAGKLAMMPPTVKQNAEVGTLVDWCTSVRESLREAGVDA